MGLPSSSGIVIGRLPKGAKNLITDVRGVQVGHCTLQEGDIHTGVTAVLPHPGNLFRKKVLASSFVLNGFGKTAGLVQVEELGSIESPIALTNTLSVGTVWESLVKVLLEQNPEIGVSTGTVNPLVAECNDGRLNDIRGLHVKEHHLLEALHAASPDFAEGSVGAGTGMVCLGFKGGIGSSSRLLFIAGKKWTLGALVLSNFGASGNLTVNGRQIHPSAPKAVCAHGAPSQKSPFPSQKGSSMVKDSAALDPLFSNAACSCDPSDSSAAPLGDLDEARDQGSIIMLLATDLPVSERQLKRMAKRSAMGLGRTGSMMGNGSGDICIAFTTAAEIPHDKTADLLSLQMTHEEDMDQVFEAVIEAIEEAILSSLWHSPSTQGIRGYHAPSFKDWWEKNSTR